MKDLVRQNQKLCRLWRAGCPLFFLSPKGGCATPTRRRIERDSDSYRSGSRSPHPNERGLYSIPEKGTILGGGLGGFSGDAVPGARPVHSNRGDPAGQGGIPPTGS